VVCAGGAIAKAQHGDCAAGNSFRACTFCLSPPVWHVLAKKIGREFPSGGAPLSTVDEEESEKNRESVEGEQSRWRGSGPSCLDCGDWRRVWGDVGVVGHVSALEFR